MVAAYAPESMLHFFQPNENNNFEQCFNSSVVILLKVKQFTVFANGWTKGENTERHVFYFWSSKRKNIVF